MFAELSDRAKSLHAELKSFMAEEVYPNEKALLTHADGAERWTPRPLLAALQAKREATSVDAVAADAAPADAAPADAVAADAATPADAGAAPDGEAAATAGEQSGAAGPASED